MESKNQYQSWVENAEWDIDVKKELIEMQTNTELRNDAFYKELTFGTGGLRGVMGAGTNRMNVHVVARASQGIAEYIKRNSLELEKKVAVCYDSRIKSKEFAEIACGVFAANGFMVFIYPEIMPTPFLSFAVRQLGCVAGVMITASHNPSKYNGYKVYGADGCQITTTVAASIQDEINKVDVFKDVKYLAYSDASQDNLVECISEKIYDEYIDEIKKQSLITAQDNVDKSINIVYSPLNGTGLKPVMKVLSEAGFRNVSIVKEQELPNGKFPTCLTPNPELEETMDLSLKYAKRIDSEIVLATDPDCDRVGVGVRNSKGEYSLLSGNEIGLLLTDYICQRLKNMKKMPQQPVLVKTIVTSDLAERIANYYGVQVINILTGFKYIGEQIGLLESQRKEESYIFGFEESCGYLRGTYVRDKDAVGACFLICEMASYYKANGKSTFEKLEELYKEFGFTLNKLHSYEFEGERGFYKMQEIMRKFRERLESFGGKRVVSVLDYAKGIEGLPKSDVLKFQLEGECSFVIRPSGTEPKLKVYISANAKTKEQALNVENLISNDFRKCIETIK